MIFQPFCLGPEIKRERERKRDLGQNYVFRFNPLNFWMAATSDTFAVRRIRGEFLQFSPVFSLGLSGLAFMECERSKMR